MAHISKRNRRKEREVQQALNNRLELVKEGFSRRDLIKMGLMTSAGVLIAKGGLTHAQWGGHNSGCYGNNCDVGCSPQPGQVFIDPMPIPPELPARPLSDPGLTFGAPPQQFPFNTINPATGLPYEGRGQYNGSLRPGSDFFQFFTQYPTQKYYVERGQKCQPYTRQFRRVSQDSHRGLRARDQDGSQHGKQKQRQQQFTQPGLRCHRGKNRSRRRQANGSQRQNQ